MFILDAIHQMNYSIAVRGKGGKRGENTWAGLIFYVWELAYCIKCRLS